MLLESISWNSLFQFPTKMPTKKDSEKLSGNCHHISISCQQATYCLHLKEDGCKANLPRSKIKQKWLNLDMKQRVEKPILKKKLTLFLLFSFTVWFRGKKLNQIEHRVFLHYRYVVYLGILPLIIFFSYINSWITPSWWEWGTLKRDENKWWLSVSWWV